MEACGNDNWDASDEVDGEEYGKDEVGAGVFEVVQNDVVDMGRVFPWVILLTVV